MCHCYKAALHVVVRCTTHAPECVPSYEEIRVRETAVCRRPVAIRFGVDETAVRHLEVALRPGTITRTTVAVRNSIGHDPILPRRDFNACTSVMVHSEPLALEAVALGAEGIRDQ